MNTSFLIEKISKPISKKVVLSLAKDNADNANAVLKLCTHHNYEVAFRAAWILEMIVEIAPESFSQHLSEFIDAYLKLDNQSGQRHFTKILMGLTHTKKDIVSEDKLDAIVETTFEWLIDPETPVAVRVNCMDILYDLKDNYDWIAEELRAQIEFQLQNGSAALQSRGRRILTKLSKRQRKSQ